MRPQHRVPKPALQIIPYVSSSYGSTVVWRSAKDFYSLFGGKHFATTDSMSIPAGKISGFSAANFLTKASGLSGMDLICSALSRGCFEPICKAIPNRVSGNLGAPSGWGCGNVSFRASAKSNLQM
jgi:hypothetical protein